MAKPELLTSVSSLSKKIDLLLENNEKLQNTIKDLKKDNEELKRQHNEDLLLLKKAHKEIESMAFSFKLASNPEDLVSAKAKIAKLIRTIDNCIRMINEDE